MFFSVFFLYSKHNVGNDSTIAEWIINYHGGFTKRGLIGEISIFFSSLFSISLRETIFYLQVLLIGIYFTCILYFLKEVIINRLILLSIFTPIFILYPVAEIEVLARKEIFIFIFLIIYIFIPKDKKIIQNIYKTVFLLLGVLIWEPIIFFFPFWLAIDITRHNYQKININFLKNLIYYFPSLTVGFYIAINPMSLTEHSLMSEFLKSNFNENCYGACALLKSKSTLYDNMIDTIRLLSLEVFIRYIFIIIIGFGPVILLLKSFKFSKNKYLLFKSYKNLFFPFLIILCPVLILFLMGVDWGRWVNISYVHTIIFFIYLYKEKYIVISKNKLKLINLEFLSKKIFVFIFIIFCFGWNPKTLLTGDIGSFPGYRIPYKIIKTIL
mgnify:CR=1 FL=1|tara:strand:+ start:4607 stop:5755 length:1149 start_codon:yes stop_codon:yes gene_type:complete